VIYNIVQLIPSRVLIFQLLSKEWGKPQLVGCAGKMIVTMNNIATVSGFQFVIMDSADIFVGTGVISSLTGWTISGNELESGGYSVVGFSMTGAPIPAGSVTTFELALTVDTEALSGNYPVSISYSYWG